MFPFDDVIMRNKYTYTNEHKEARMQWKSLVKKLSKHLIKRQHSKQIDI